MRKRFQPRWSESAVLARAKSGIAVSRDAFMTAPGGSFRPPGQEETFMKLRIAFDELLPATTAARELPQALDRLDRGEVEQLVITKRNEPRAALVSVDRYQELLLIEHAHNSNGNGNGAGRSS